MRHVTYRAVAGCCAMLASLASTRIAPAQSMSDNEAKATRLSSQWRDGAGLITKGADGKVIFLYGQSQPFVVCSPLQVCDIELEAGEVVRDVLVGDTVRWKVEPATSGPIGGQAIHLIVKPAEPGLSTSMVVTTSRRTYHIQLKSHSSRYMARVGFSYSQDVTEKLAEANARLDFRGAPGTAMPPDQLDFSYSVSGSAAWKPTRVYSDGLKTYIQFPRSVAGEDAPVLFIVSEGKNRIVNYRMTRNMMVVDYNVDRAVLVSGVGWRRQKITIRRSS